MTRGTELTAKVIEALEQIRGSNDFETTLAAVYPPLTKAPSQGPLPYALVRVTNDRIEKVTGRTVKRVRTYEIEFGFARSTPWQSVETAHHDLLRAFGLGQLQPARKLPGWADEEEVDYFPADVDGSTVSRLICSFSAAYVETY